MELTQMKSPVGCSWQACARSLRRSRRAPMSKLASCGHMSGKKGREAPERGFGEGT